MTNLPHWYLKRIEHVGDCWMWRGDTNGQNIARIQLVSNGPQINVSRLVVETLERPLGSGEYVIHTCKNKFCVRPEHLTIGTAKDRGGRPPQDVSTRFWSKVLKGDGCWLWTGATFPKGRPQFKYNGKTCYGARVAWELTHGPIMASLSVCHTCDNILCVRPDHLFLGTTADNQHDKVRKGRQAAGERCGTYKHGKYAGRHRERKRRAA